ncbi:hypothetical protein Tco_0977379 [Tanacetum coccineum]|uniref:Uncharacterized protein n=1 Tax=Tanacetum coccineum TaxID=301880 RepID=A0ABQ5EL21_9ASTR
MEKEYGRARQENILRCLRDMCAESNSRETSIVKDLINLKDAEEHQKALKLQAFLNVSKDDGILQGYDAIERGTDTLSGG